MIQRVSFRIAGAVLFAFAVLAVQAIAQPHNRAEQPKGVQTPAGKHGGREAIDHCAKACNDCQRSCDLCATHCVHLVAQGAKEHLRTLQTCRDCATICSSAAHIVARHGPFTDLICQSCVEACARCGKACEQHASDTVMKACAEECRRCEQACRDMLR
jgi:hypothetical protein